MHSNTGTLLNVLGRYATAAGFLAILVILAAWNPAAPASAREAGWTIPNLTAVGDDAPSDCEECKGGVISLTLRYDGTSPAVITAESGNSDYNIGLVQPGDTFTITGTKSDGKFDKNEVKLFVDGQEEASFHVSCSKPIGPGTASGPFTVTAATSKDNGEVCPVLTPPDGDCGECKGGLTSLTLRYDGTTAATIRVEAGNKMTYNVGLVQPGDEFTITGTGKDGKFKKNTLDFFIDGSKDSDLHVSCSKPVENGMSFGSFTIRAGVSRKGGALCPIDTPEIDLELDKTVFSHVGNEITYRVTLSNSNDVEVPATDVSVAESFPASFDFTGASASQGSVDSSTLVWDAGTIGVGQTATLDITFQTNTTPSGSTLLPNGIYQLHDHPDGNARSPLYGLRLDELFGGFDTVTFSFDQGGADVTMEVDGSNVTISGTVYGGRDTGSSYDSDNSGLWDLYFRYTDALDPVSGDDDLFAEGWEAGKGQGAITPLFSSAYFDAGDVYDLRGHPSGGTSFRLGDEDNDNGHRSASDISGWGWLKHGQDGSFTHTNASDWLFTARLETENAVRNCVQVKDANETDRDSTPGNGFRRGEDDDDCAVVVFDEPQIDMELEKTVDRDDIVAGETVTYTLLVRNDSAVEGHDIYVADYLPESATVVSVSGGGQLSTQPGGSEKVTWFIPLLPEWGTETFTIEATLDEPGKVTNCAEIWDQAPGDEDSAPGNFDGQPGEDDEACVDVWVADPTIDLELQKSFGTYDPDTQTATYALTVRNTGAAPATGVVVRDHLPAGALVIAGSDDATQGSFSGSDWAVGDLPINSGAELRFAMRIGEAGDSRNCAEVLSADQTDTDSTPGNFYGRVDEDDEACDEIPLIDLRLEKSALDPTTVNVGELAAFEITVTNDGPADATGVKVLDRLPVGLVIDSGVPTTGSFDASTGVWTIGNLSASQSVTLKLNVIPQEAGEFKNCAEVKAADLLDRDSTPGNLGNSAEEDDEDCARIWVNDPQIDLWLKKTASPTNARVGDEVTYTLTLSNQSDTQATNVFVTDYLPAGVTYVSSTPDRNSGSGTTWTISDLDPYSEVEILVKVLVNRAGEHVNCAEVWDADQKDTDSTPGNFNPNNGPKEDDEACASIWTDNPETDLTLEKTVDTDRVLTGETVNYTLTVTNESSVAANGVQVADYLPQDLTIVSHATATGTLSGTTWDVGYLAGNTSATLLLAVKVDKAGEHTNCAEIWDASPKDEDSTPGNFRSGSREDDDSCVTIWAADPETDLELEKTVSESDVATGDSVTYTLTVSNASDTPATGVQVADYLPAGVEFQSATPSAGTVSSGGTSWYLGTLAEWSDATLDIVVKVTGTGKITNCAEIWDASPADVDSTPGNLDRASGPQEGDESCVSLWANDPRIDLSLDKSVSKSVVKVGETVQYTIEVTNDGPGDATGVQVADYLPNGLWLLSSDASVGAFSNGTWNIGDLANGASAVLTLDVRIDAEGELVNCAEVWDADQEDVDSETGAESGRMTCPPSEQEDDEDSAPVWSNANKIDLDVDKKVDDAYPKLDQTVTYTVAVANNGSAEATGVFVKDYLPDGLEYVWDSATTISGNVSFDTSSLTWNIQWIGAGESIELTLQALVKETGEFRNCAEVWDADQSDVDSITGDERGSALDCPGLTYDNQEDDEDFADLWVNTPPQDPQIDLEVEKSVSTAYPAVGHTVQYTIEVSNAGVAEATNVFVKDYLPSGLSYVWDTATTNGNVAFDTGSLTWQIDWIGSGQTVTLTLDAIVNQDGEWKNCAEVWDADQEDTDSLTGDQRGSSLDCEGLNSGNQEDDESFVRIWASPGQTGDAICYLVADNDGTAWDSQDVLTKLTAGAQVETIIGNTYTRQIESIAFNPWTGELFAADARRLGTLDPATGSFTEIGEFGYGEGYDPWGQQRTRGFLDVDGLTFDPYTGELYGSIRKVGERDLLIKIDPATGKALEDAFGAGKDYVTIMGLPGLTDIDDIAIDPTDGTMYGVNNEDGVGSKLVRIDKTTGSVSNPVWLPVANVEGLAFFGDGTMYGTGGEGFENILVIDKVTFDIDVVSTIGTGGNRDYESVACLTNKPNRVSVTLFGDQNADGVMQPGEAGFAGLEVELLRDTNRDGMADGGDLVVASARSDGSGTADFHPAANGRFVYRVTNGAGQVLTEGAYGGATLRGFGVETTDYMALAASVATGSEAEGDLPSEFRLQNNYPNPFNPTTTIAFDLPESVKVRLAVFDLLGRQVALLVDGVTAAGSHEVTFQAGSLPSGMYLYRLQTDARVLTQTMTLIK
jgi:uncharacterized repeat protein (TIGR01451 family)